MDRLLQSATGALALLDILGSTAPYRPNVWTEQATRLRAAIDRLKAAMTAADTGKPTRV